MAVYFKRAFEGLGDEGRNLYSAGPNRDVGSEDIGFLSGFDGDFGRCGLNDKRVEMDFDAKFF